MTCKVFPCYIEHMLQDDKYSVTLDTILNDGYASYSKARILIPADVNPEICIVRGGFRALFCCGTYVPDSRVGDYDEQSGITKLLVCPDHGTISELRTIKCKVERISDDEHGAIYNILSGSVIDED